MKFTTWSTRRIGSVLVLHQWSKAATWLVTGPKHLKLFVPPDISMHRMKFYREDRKRFVNFKEKTLKKLNFGGLVRGSVLKGTRRSYISLPEREIHKILTNRHHAGCQKVFDKWSILPKQIDCFSAVIIGEVNVLVTCETHMSTFQVIKCPHPRETFR